MIGPKYTAIEAKDLTATVRRRSRRSIDTDTDATILVQKRPIYKHLQHLEIDSDSSTEAETASCTSTDTSTITSSHHAHYSWYEYAMILYTYPQYRYFFISVICQHMGDWFVRIASLLVVERFSGKGSALAYLVLCILLPKLALSHVGGMLADRFNKRQLMIILDITAGISVLGYLVALYYRSLAGIYATTVVRSAIHSLYYPAATGIIPQLVPNNAHDLKLAMTINSWAWSGMAILGGTMAGSVTAVIGLRACYLVDVGTYFVSAAVVWYGISGSNVVDDSSSHNALDLHTPVTSSMKQVWVYLSNCSFGLLVVLKGSAALVWGPEDIIGIEFATVRDPQGNEIEGPSSIRMGLLFSVIGLGSFLGPYLINFFTDAERPVSIQQACLIGLVIQTAAWLTISAKDDFVWFLVGSLFRSGGGTIVWVNSTFLLQTLCDKDVLSRVLAIDYALQALLEGASSTSTGALLDVGFDKCELALFGAGLGVLASSFWGVYHVKSLRAASRTDLNDFVAAASPKESTTSSPSLEFSPSISKVGVTGLDEVYGEALV